MRRKRRPTSPRRRCTTSWGSLMRLRQPVISDERYDAFVVDDHALERGLADGSLVEDTRVRDALRVLAGTGEVSADVSRRRFAAHSGTSAAHVRATHRCRRCLVRRRRRRVRGSGARPRSTATRRPRAARRSPRAWPRASARSRPAAGAASRRRVVTGSNSPTSRPLAGLRVTLVLNWADLGGAEQNALTVARSLRDDLGADVEFLALTDRPGRAADAVRALGMAWRSVVVDWDGSKGAKAGDYTRFLLALRRGKPDLVMSYCSLPNVLCGLAWRAAGASTSVWQQQDVSPFRRARDSTRRRAAGRTPVFVANAAHGAEHLVSDVGCASRAYSRDPLRHRGPPCRAGSRRVACSARSERRRLRGVHGRPLPPVEGSPDLAPILASRRRRARAGRDAAQCFSSRVTPYPMQDAAKALAFDLRLDESVRFLGVVDDVPGVVGAADVSVLSSLREGLPRSLLESMGAGVRGRRNRHSGDSRGGRCRGSAVPRATP